MYIYLYIWDLAKKPLVNSFLVVFLPDRTTHEDENARPTLCFLVGSRGHFLNCCGIPFWTALGSLRVIFWQRCCHSGSIWDPKAQRIAQSDWIATKIIYIYILYIYMYIYIYIYIVVKSPMGTSFSGTLRHVYGYWQQDLTSWTAHATPQLMVFILPSCLRAMPMVHAIVCNTDKYNECSSLFYDLSNLLTQASGLEPKQVQRICAYLCKITPNIVSAHTVRHGSKGQPEGNRWR